MYTHLQNLLALNTMRTIGNFINILFKMQMQICYCSFLNATTFS